MVGIDLSDDEDRDPLRTDSELSLLSPPDGYQSDISIEELEDSLEE
jgi:hypothetical protein